MNQVLSSADIHRQFDSEWVLVIDPELDASLEVLRGEVACHSKDRDEVYRKALELAPTHSAILYTGQLPDNLEIVLSTFRLPSEQSCIIKVSDSTKLDWQEGVMPRGPAKTGSHVIEKAYRETIFTAQGKESTRSAHGPWSSIARNTTANRSQRTTVA